MEGEWFKWLSADDVLYPSAVEELISKTKNLKDSTKTILYSNYHIINSDSIVTREHLEQNINNLNSFDHGIILLDFHIGNGTASLIHKSAFDKYGMFDESLDYNEDYELWLRLVILHKFRLHLLPKILAKYRVHQTQLTQTIPRKKIEERSDMIRRYVLDKLNSKERQRYEIALSKYKRRSLIARTKPVYNKLKKFFPKSLRNFIRKIYWKYENRRTKKTY